MRKRMTLALPFVLALGLIETPEAKAGLGR